MQSCIVPSTPLFDALEADNRPLPWDDSESFDMFLADKTF